ncbi:hypothetical protein FRB99_006196 [Tulasnella sp. 403]|nr:hypothetical protein FRB99_006196 [Tulasnella sp. 403]
MRFSVIIIALTSIAWPALAAPLVESSSAPLLQDSRPIKRIHDGSLHHKRGRDFIGDGHTVAEAMENSQKVLQLTETGTRKSWRPRNDPIVSARRQLIVVLCNVIQWQENGIEEANYLTMYGVPKPDGKYRYTGRIFLNADEREKATLLNLSNRLLERLPYDVFSWVEIAQSVQQMNPQGDSTVLGAYQQLAEHLQNVNESKHLGLSASPEGDAPVRILQALDDAEVFDRLSKQEKDSLKRDVDTLQEALKSLNPGGVSPN